MITNDLINVLYNCEGEEGERSTQHSSGLFFNYSAIIDVTKANEHQGFAERFQLYNGEGIVVFGEGGQMESCSTKENKVRIKYRDLWKDRAFSWTANFSFFF